MFEYYIDFKIKDSQISYFLNRLFTKVHGFMNGGKYSFAIDFPNMTDKSLGNTLRVFSSALPIDKMVNDSRINMYIKNGIIETTYLLKVPSNIENFVVVKRNRFAEKPTYPKDKQKPFYVSYINNVTDKKIPIYIERDVVNNLLNGEFTSFGTSKDGSNIPLF